MNKPGLGGGMKRGSGRGRRLDFLPSSSLSPSAPPFWRNISCYEGQFKKCKQMRSFSGLSKQFIFHE